MLYLIHFETYAFFVNPDLHLSAGISHGYQLRIYLPAERADSAVHQSREGFPAG